MDVQATRLRPKSVARYRQIARDYVFPYLAKMKIRDLTIFEVERLYQRLTEQGVSIRNVRYVHSLLHKSLKDANLRGLIHNNPAHGARQPKMPKKEMQILDEYQVMQFLLVAKGHRFEALFNLAIKTGMRQGEILGLKWSDISWQGSSLRVLRKVYREKGKGRVFSPPKTRAGLRTIPLGSETLRLLQEHRKQQEVQKVLAGDRWREHGLIFPSKVGTPYSASSLLNDYKEVLEAAGLPQVRFHALRHTAASIMLNRGVPPFVVSKILGHSEPSITLNTYGHLIPIMHEELGNQMDEWLTPILVEMGKSVQNTKPPE
jgi:integrase